MIDVGDLQSGIDDLRRQLDRADELLAAAGELPVPEAIRWMVLLAPLRAELSGFLQALARQAGQARRGRRRAAWRPPVRLAGDQAGADRGREPW
jgi:hypothetical protein